MILMMYLMRLMLIYLMGDDMTTWLALGLQTLAVLGALAGIYARISSRLAVIEVRLNIDDAQRSTEEKAAAIATKLLLVEHCRAERKQCPAYQEHVRWNDTSSVTDPGVRK
jgi:hypothetical protein